MEGAAVCAGVHAFSVCAESHFQILLGLRQQDRTMNRELQRSADDRRLGGGMGLVAGPTSSPMAKRKQNVRSRRRRAIGWPAKTGPVAGPSEPPMTTRPESLTRQATAFQMATVVALDGAIVYHDADVRTTARRVTVGHMARGVVSWGQRKIVTKRCTRGGLACGFRWTITRPARVIVVVRR